MVAMTGDLIQDGGVAAYERFCKLFSTLELPVHCIPGNHDDRALMQETLQRQSFSYCDIVRAGAWSIIGLDSCLASGAAGEIDPQEMSRLRNFLDTAENEHVLICLHHPPLPVGSKWLDGVGLTNAADFFKLISGYDNVRGALFGHVHQPFEADVGGIRIIGTPSTCRQFKAHSDEFAVDDNPPAYRRINLLDDGTIDDELVWVE